MLVLLLGLAAAAAATSPYLPSTPPGTYPFAHFTVRRSDRAARASATTVEAFFSASMSSLTPAEAALMFVVSQ